MTANQAIVNQPIPRESTGTVCREVLKKTVGSLFTVENLEWLGMLFLGVNLGLLGVHRLAGRKYFSGAVMLVCFCASLALYVLPLRRHSFEKQSLIGLWILATLITVGIYLVDIWRIFTGKFDVQKGKTFQCSWPGEIKFGVALVVLLNIQLLVLLFLQLPPGTIFQPKP